MLGSSCRGDLVEVVLSEAEGAARRKELEFVSHRKPLTMDQVFRAVVAAMSAALV